MGQKSPEELAVIERLKELQRSDLNGRQCWWEYCDAQGGGVRDPGKHDVGFVINFLDLYKSGRLQPSQPVKENDSGKALVDLLKEGQRRSHQWKCAWASYTQLYGGGVSDPSKHKQSFLIGFLDFLGQSGSGGAAAAVTNMMIMAPGKGARPRGPEGVGNSEKDLLVSKVKAYQRQGELQREEWGSFCDNGLNGIRDPARHPMEVLEEFLAQHPV